MQKLSVKPFLKWAGGKRKLIPELEKYIPDTYKTYYEPFIGAGALFLYLCPERAVINDINSQLINCYRVIKENPEELILKLKSYVNTEDEFYRIRKLDRQDNFSSISDIEKAARIIYLNKTCFNGLYRVNQKGYFNAPYGKYDNPLICDESNIRALNELFNKIDLTIKNGTYIDALDRATEGDFVYIDPPYDPISTTASFTSYTQDGFNREDQEQLKGTIDTLSDKGVKVLASNSATDFIRELYSDYDIIEITASRNINSDASKRKPVKELIIKNF